MNFCERLEELKTQKNVLQKAVANGVNLPLRTYQRYEHGERLPDLVVLIALADFFGVSLDYLVGRSDDPKRY